MKKNQRSFFQISPVLFAVLSLSMVSSVSASISMAAPVCAGVHQGSQPTVLSRLEKLTADLVPFEDVAGYLLGPSLAKEGSYVRRPTAAEIERALKAGLFPDHPSVRSALFVVQKGTLDYSKTGEIRIARGAYAQKKWNDGLDFTSLEKKMKSQLEGGQIANEISLGQYKNALSNIEGSATDVGGNKADHISLITLKDGTRGVFKAFSIQQAVAEVAASLFAKALGMNNVPPTVIATHKGKVGSFQYFIENPSTGLNKAHGANREALISKEDLANMELFYIMSGNWDAHPGNRIVDIKGGLGLIDNEAITRPQYYRYGELPWFALLQKGKSNKTEFVTPESDAFPFEQARYFHKPTVEDVLSIAGRTGYDPELIHSKLLWYQQDSGRIGIIEWQNTLWFQLNIPEYYRARIPEYFPASTIQAASQMNMQRLKQIFQEPFKSISGDQVFKEADLRRIQSRIAEVLKAAQK